LVSSALEFIFESLGLGLGRQGLGHGLGRQGLGLGLGRQGLGLGLGLECQLMNNLLERADQLYSDIIESLQ